MALRRRGTRLITLGGTQYRWVVSPNDGWMDLVVELAEGAAQRLVARGTYYDAWLAFGDAVNGRRLVQQPRV